MGAVYEARHLDLQKRVAAHPFEFGFTEGTGHRPYFVTRPVALWLEVALIKRLSPDSHSVMEFKGEADVLIAEKMLQFPLLGERMERTWNLSLTREFDMTNDSYLFKTEPFEGRLPLFEGKMIHQFEHGLASPRFWLNESDGRKAICGRAGDHGQTLS